EGLSNAILEALAARLPVVAYDVGGNGELVNEQRGVLVPPNEESAFANAIQELCSDNLRRRELGANAFQFVERSFASARIIRQYEDLYQDLLKAKGRQKKFRT